MKQSLAIAVLMASGIVLGAAAQTPAESPAAAPANTPATSAAAPATPKIAVIAFQVAVGQTNEFQRNFADLQKKYDPKRQQLKARNIEIDIVTKQRQEQGKNLVDDMSAPPAPAADRRQEEAASSDRAGDISNDFQNEMQEMYQGLASKVYDVLSTYAQQHGYTLVLDVAQQQTPVLYAVDSTNITKPIIDAYNVKSGVPAPPQPAAGTPPAAPPVAPKPSAPRTTPPTSH